MPKTITVKNDPSCEMIEILIDEKFYWQGNYWDLNSEVWMILINSQLGVKVKNKKYKFKRT
jgi:hypothetical protein